MNGFLGYQNGLDTHVDLTLTYFSLWGCYKWKTSVAAKALKKILGDNVGNN